MIRLVWVALLICTLGGCATTTSSRLPRAGTTAPPGQDVKLAAYNVGLGAVVGGVGAVINSDDGPLLRRFARGAGWGALGGSVAYAGKWAAGEIGASERLAYGLPARLVHEAGVSVVENTARGNAPLDRFSSHFGPVRLDIRPATGGVQARLLPVNALAIAVMLADPDLDLLVGRSLVYGVPLFSGDGSETAPLGFDSAGLAVLGSAFVSRDVRGFHNVAAHELVHVMQFSEIARYESALRAPLESRRSRELGRWTYLDSPVLNWLGYFGVEGGDIEAPCKYDNWFEREAEAFGRRRAVGVCP